MATHSEVGLTHRVLQDVFDGGAHLRFANGTFQHFCGTHWKSLPEAQLGGMILKNLPQDFRRGLRPSTAVREVIAQLKMLSAADHEVPDISEAHPVINVANCELWVPADGSAQPRPHDPSSEQRHCLAVNYDPDAQCPEYDNALSEIFSGSPAQEELAEFWNEIVGYTLQPSRPDARIFVGSGQGGDGKSSLAGLLMTMLGKHQVAAMPISKLDSDDFMISHLEGKRLLLDDDVAVDTVLPDGILKTISERKLVTAARKFRDAVEYEVCAVPILLCNSVPRLLDKSSGFRRRLCVIPFDRRFTDLEADRGLFQRIRETEMSGVLNRALAGLKRVVQRDWKLAPPDAVLQATNRWWSEATGSAGHLVATPIISAPVPTARPAPRQARAALQAIRGPVRASGSNPKTGTANLSELSIHVDESAQGPTVKVQTSGVAITVCMTRDEARA